ncbi:MAG: hypothetical protein ACFFDT_10675, partial [Candidatus Hodarchaeota archaeon]
MDWIDFLEDFWEDVKERTYYIIAFILLISVPFILAVPGFVPIPIISDLYAIGRNADLFDANTYVISVLSLCAIWAIFAAAWDLLSGYTGQVSFGHAIFWGLAAYASFWFATGFNVGFTLIQDDAYLFGPPIDAFLITILNTVISFINNGLKWIFTSKFSLNLGK